MKYISTELQYLIVELSRKNSGNVLLAVIFDPLKKGRTENWRRAVF